MSDSATVLITDNEQRIKNYCDSFIFMWSATCRLIKTARLSHYSLWQLRAHGLIKKGPETYRDMQTEKLRDIITGLMAARCAIAEMLIKTA